MEIQLFGEGHTLGNLIATTLQKCDFIEKAGYDVPHPFIDQVTIVYQIKNNSKIKPINALIDTIDYLVRLFQTIAHVFSKKIKNVDFNMKSFIKIVIFFIIFL